jgi:hypothetical protein
MATTIAADRRRHDDQVELGTIRGVRRSAERLARRSARSPPSSTEPAAVTN